MLISVIINPATIKCGVGQIRLTMTFPSWWLEYCKVGEGQYRTSY